MRFGNSQNREHQPKGMVWFRGQYVPIIYASRKGDFLGSKQWVARGTTQRIGAGIFAIVFLLGSVLAFVASPLVREEAMEDVGGIFGQVFGFLLSGLAVLIACAMMFAAFRLAKGIARSFQKPPNSRLTN